MRRAPHSIFYKILASLLATVLVLLVVEVALRYGAASASERQIGARNLLTGATNRFTQRAESDSCAWADSVVAHPYLAYVHHAIPPCGLSRVNNAGMESDLSLPLAREPQFFTVLLEGASVAEQLGAGDWLRQAFEKRYHLPDGRRFRFLNAAIGATSYPRQAILTLLYGHAVDAVLVLDGFNEVAFSSHSGSLLGAPSQVYLRQIKRPGANRLLARMELSRWVGEGISGIPLLSRSFLGYFLYRATTPSELARGSARDMLDWDERSAAYLQSFVAPDEWSLNQRRDWNAERYVEGVRLNQALAKSLEIAFAHFLQPVPNLFKPLTVQERAMQITSFDTTQYLNIERRLAEPSESPIASYSLLRLFDGVESPIYADFIHCEMNAAGSIGYEMIAAAIAQRVGSSWGLSPTLMSQ